MNPLKDPHVYIAVSYLALVLLVLWLRPKWADYGWRKIEAAIRKVREAFQPQLKEIPTYGATGSDCWVIHRAAALELELYGMIMSPSYEDHLERCNKYRSYLIPENACNHLETTVMDLGTLGLGPDPVEVCHDCGMTRHINESDRR